LKNGSSYEGILTYSKIDKETSKLEIIDTHEIVQSIIDIIHLPDHITSIISSLLELKQINLEYSSCFKNWERVNYIDKEQGLVEVAATQDGDTYVFYKDKCRNAKKIHSKYLKPFKSLQQANTQQV
jgi:hypothetical protein